MRIRPALLGAAAAALALCGSAFAEPPQVPANVFTDPAGDAIGAAPDVTGLTYTMDAQGVARVAVAVAQTPGQPTAVLLLVDEDNNTATGDPSLRGADYWVEYDDATSAVAVLVWDREAGGWKLSRYGTNLGASASSTGVVFTLDRQQLGYATAAQVFVLTLAFDPASGLKVESDGTTPDIDRAPDDGAYAVDFEPLSLDVAGMTHSQPRANGRFTVAMTTTRSDSHEYVSRADGTVMCALTVAGKRQAPLTSPLISAGDTPAATCAWKLGKKAKGKQLRLAITVEAGGASVTKTYSARVR